MSDDEDEWLETVKALERQLLDYEELRRAWIKHQSKKDHVERLPFPINFEMFIKLASEDL